VLEFLMMNGRTLQEAVLMMVPEAWQNDANMSDEKFGFNIVICHINHANFTCHNDNLFHFPAAYQRLEESVRHHSIYKADDRYLAP
jgi:hypothetical protein